MNIFPDMPNHVVSQDRPRDPIAGRPAAAPPSGSTRSALAREEEGGASFRLALDLSEPVQVLLAVVAAHDRIAPEEVICRAVCARAEEIGIQNLGLTGEREALHRGPEAGTKHIAGGCGEEGGSESHCGPAPAGDAARGPP